MLDGSADLGGDGLGLDEKEFRLSGGRLIGRLLIFGQKRGVSVLVISGFDGKGSGSRSFDGGKSGYDGAVGV